MTRRNARQNGGQVITCRTRRQKIACTRAVLDRQERSPTKGVILR